MVEKVKINKEKQEILISFTEEDARNLILDYGKKFTTRINTNKLRKILISFLGECK